MKKKSRVILPNCDPEFFQPATGQPYEESTIDEKGKPIVIRGHVGDKNWRIKEARG